MLIRPAELTHTSEKFEFTTKQGCRNVTKSEGPVRLESHLEQKITPLR